MASGADDVPEENDFSDMFVQALVSLGYLAQDSIPHERRQHIRAISNDDSLLCSGAKRKEVEHMLMDPEAVQISKAPMEFANQIIGQVLTTAFQALADDEQEQITEAEYYLAHPNEAPAEEGLIHYETVSMNFKTQCIPLIRETLRAGFRIEHPIEEPIVSEGWIEAYISNLEYFAFLEL